MTTEVRTRFPGRVYRQGTEPDPRFSLANERTFLAWIRTSLALLAGGVAIEALNFPIQPVLRLAAAILFVSLGALCSSMAWIGWLRIERALRLGRPLPGPSLGVVVAVGVAVGAILIGIGLWL